MIANFNIIDLLVKNYNILCPKQEKYVVNRKYTNYEYFEEIIKFFRNSTYWRRIEGKINGRVLNNKHNEYVRSGVYELTYREIINDIKTINTNYSSIDTTYIPNKNRIKTKTNKIEKNQFYKNKFGVKISTIVDINGIPISLVSICGSTNDNITLRETIDSVIYIDKKKPETNKMLLADKSYDSINNRKYCKKNMYTPIIAQNKRNIKDPKHIVEFNDATKLIYKKRIIVENVFARFKSGFPRMNFMYDKNINTYMGGVFLYFIYMLAHTKICIAPISKLIC